MPDKIVVYVELNSEKEVLPVSLETLNIGKTLAGKTGGKLVAVVVGSGISHTAEEIGQYGADTVYCADSQDLERYQPENYMKVMEKVVAELDPYAILLGNSLVSIDLAPRITLALNTGLITDCSNIDVVGGEMLCTKAVYSSNVMAEYGFETLPGVVTVRARSFDPAEKQGGSGEVIQLSVDVDNTSNKIKYMGETTQDAEGPQLSTANIIVAGGRGLGDEEGFEELKELCSTLGAALGASRPPCDLDWISAKHQIGLTGEIVAPALYIAVGISGSFQHIAGMSDSKVIVAINKDERANIFKVADYGIVGEFEEIIPEFNKALKEIL